MNDDNKLQELQQKVEQLEQENKKLREDLAKTEEELDYLTEIRAKSKRKGRFDDDF